MNNPIRILMIRWHVCAIAFGLLLAQRALAANDTWTGAGAPDGNWTNAANWGGTAPNAGDFLNFAGTVQTSITNDFTNGTIFGNLGFNVGAGTFTLSPVSGGDSSGIVLTNQSEAVGSPLFGGSISNLSANAQTINIPLTLSAGNHVVVLGGGTGALNLNGAFARNTGATVQYFTNGAAGIIYGNNSGLTNDNSLGGGIIGGWATIGGNWATNSPSTGIGAYSGYTVFSSGSSATAAAGSNYKFTVNNENFTLSPSSGNYIDMNSLLFAPSANNYITLKVNALGQAFRLGAEGGIFHVMNSSETTYVGQDGHTNLLTAGGSMANNPGELTLINYPFYNESGNGGNGIRIDSVITNNGTGAVSINTLGYIEFNNEKLSGSYTGNLYSAGTYVNQGRLQIDGANGAGSGPVYVYPGGQVFENGSGTVANNFYLAGYGTVNSTGTGLQEPGALRTGTRTYSGAITLLGNSVIASGNSSTFNGQITGPGGLTVIGSYGSGSMHLGESTANNYQGDTVIDATTYGNNSITIWVNNSGLNNIMPSGSGYGNLILKGGSSTMAEFDIGGSTQTVNGLSSSGTGSETLVTSNPGGGIINIGGNNATSEFDGTIGTSSGQGTANINVVKIGTGTLTLGGTNNYTGQTMVLGGTLALAGSGSINNTPQITVSNATFDVSAASAYTSTGGIAMTNSTFKLGNVLATAVGSLAVTNSTLAFALNQSFASVTVSGALISAGTTNVINLTTVPGSSYYPIQLPLIKYGSFGNVDANNNLTNLGVNLPALGHPVGYLTNNTANGSIDLVLTSGPIPVEPITWNGQTNGVYAGNWDILTTSNWLYGGQPYFYQDTSPVTFDDSLSGTGNVNLTATLSPASITLNNYYTNYVFSGVGKISGATGLTKNGSASLTLAESGGDNFSGGVTVNNGALVIDNNSSGITGGTTIYGGMVQVGNGDTNGVLPSGGVSDYSALVFNRSDAALTVANIISGNGTVTNNGSGTVTLTANNPVSGGVFINNGTLRANSVGSGNSALGSGNTLVNSGGTLVGGGSDAFGYGFNNNPDTIVINGGTVTDLGSSSYRITTPNLNFTGGTLTSAAGNNGDGDGNYSLFGNGSSCTVTVNATNTTAVISAGAISLQEPTTFNVLGNGSSGPAAANGVDLLVTSVLKPFGAQPLTKSGPGVMALDSSSPNNAGTVTVNQGTLQLGTTNDVAPLIAPMGTNSVAVYSSILDFASSQGVTVGNVISDNSAGTVMISSGTNYLTAANTYSGNTLVNGGKLALTGAGSINSSASIIVSNATLDASAMSGPFANTGSLSLTNSMFNLGTNLVTSLSSFAISNTTLIVSPNTNTANISLTSGSGSLFTGGTTNVIRITSVPSVQMYPASFPVIKYIAVDAGVTNSNNKLTTLGVTFAAPGNPTGYLTNDTANNSIDVVLVSGPPIVTPIKWTGITNSVNIGNWDILNTTNWVTVSGGVPYPYQDGSVVSFDDTAAGTTTVNLTATLSPASVTVTNNSKNYTFGGNGNLTGALTLTKSGSGTLIVDNSGMNNYTGGSLIAVGTVQVGNNDASGSLGSGGVTNNASLTFNRNDSALNMSSAISGTGTVTENGTGTVTLSGNNSYSGGATVNSGTLQVNSVGGGNSALGTGIATVNSSGTLTGGGSDAFGYGMNNNPPAIAINGGTVTDLGSSSYRITLRNLTFSNGGTLTSAVGNNGSANGNYSLFGNGTNCTVTVNASSTTATINAAAISLQEPTTFNIAAGTTPGGVDLQISSAIVTNGSNPLIKTGPGTMVLSGANTYTGNTVISNGTLAVVGSGVLGGGTYTNSITNNGTFYYDSSAQTTVSGVISGTGSLIKDNTGTLVLNASNTFTTSIIVSNGTLRANNSGAFNGNPITETTNGADIYISAGSAIYTNNFSIVGYGVTESDGVSHLGALRMASAGITLSGTITLAGDASITARGSGATGDTISGQITGPYAMRFNRVSTTNNSSGGTITLSNTGNNWTGNTTNADGTLKLGASGVIPNGPGYGNFIMTTPGAAYVLGGSIVPTVFDLSGNDETLNGLSHDPNVTGGDLSLLIITNGGASPVTLTVGNNNASGNYGGVMVDGANKLGLTKIGSGTETLSGANTYTGNTAISNGALVVNGSLGTSTVTVETNAALFGNGSLGGNVIVSVGGVISPGNGPGAIGTLTANNTVNLQGTTLMEINKASSPSNDVLVANTVFYGGALTITNLGPALAAGDSFTFLNATFSSGGFSATNLPALSAGLVWTNNAPGTWSVLSGATPVSYLKTTGFSLSGGTNLVFSGTNAGAGTIYVLASTNVALPLSQWVPLTTNVVNGTGTFIFTATNVVNVRSVKQQFYILSTTNND